MTKILLKWKEEPKAYKYKIWLVLWLLHGWKKRYPCCMAKSTVQICINVAILLAQWECEAFQWWQFVSIGFSMCGCAIGCCHSRLTHIPFLFCCLSLSPWALSAAFYPRSSSVLRLHIFHAGPKLLLSHRLLHSMWHLRLVRTGLPTISLTVFTGLMAGRARMCMFESVCTAP